MKPKRQTVMVDFDGTLTRYENGWQGYAVCEDSPVPGALHWLHKVLQVYDVRIVSGRARTLAGRRCIRRWLHDHSEFYWNHRFPSLNYPGEKGYIGFKAITVSCRKINDFVMFIDDRNWAFDGKHFPSLTTLQNFQPWNKRKELLMEGPKCWGCGGDISIKTYPVEICQACHHAGSGVESRDLFKRADARPPQEQEDRDRQVRELLKKLKELMDG